MATKKVLVEINVEQKGSAIDKTTKEVKELTAVEKERLRIKQEKIKTDAKIEVANEKATKDLAEQKKVLKELTNSEKLAEQAKKDAIATEIRLEKERKESIKTTIKQSEAEYSVKKALERQRKANIKATLRQADVEHSNKQALDKQRQAALKSIEVERLRAEAIENTTQKTEKFKTTSGLTGAIVTEFGRTASDASYGIRGMGNNISQIVTLFGQLQANTVKAGGTIKDSFAQIFQSMKGIIGLMTALQIVLGVIQAEWFQKWASGLFGVNKELDEFNENLKEATEEMKASGVVALNYAKTINDVATSEKERALAIQELTKLVPTLKEEDVAYGANLVEVKKKIDEYVLSQVSRIEIDKLVQENSQLLLKQSKLQAIAEIESLEERSEAARAFLKEQGERTTRTGASGIAVGIGVNVKEYELGTKELLKVFSDYSNEVDKQADPIIERIADLTNNLLLDEDDTRRGASARRGFRSRLLDLQTIAERFRQESLKAEVKTDEELIKEKAEFSKRDLEIKVNNFEETEKLRLQEFLKTKKLSDKQRSDAIKASEESIERAKEDSKIVLANIEAVYDAEINLLRRKEGEEARIEQEARDRAEALKGLDRGGSGVLGFNQGFVDAQNARIQNEIDYQSRLLEATEKGTLERSQAEQAYYDANNQMIQFNLQQEKLAAEEKARVNLEYVSYLSGLSSILGAIGKKNEEFQKAQLLLEKSAAIGGVVTAAAKSIGVQTAATSAANQQIIAKYAAIPGGQIPAALEIKANTALYRKGVANTKIGAGLSIAAITAGAISGVDAISTSGGGSSSGGGNTTVQPPDFNIVGSTGVNQLADAIGSTEKQPTKAYVVASDVTTQQALDRNNRSNAEL